MKIRNLIREIISEIEGHDKIINQFVELTNRIKSGDYKSANSIATELLKVPTNIDIIKDNITTGKISGNIKTVIDNLNISELGQFIDLLKDKKSAVPKPAPQSSPQPSQKTSTEQPANKSQQTK